MATFVSTKYEADDGEIHPIRLSPDTAAVSGNPPPSGVVTNRISASTSKSRRGYGLHARRVNIKKTVSAANGTATIFSQVPLLTPGAGTSPAFAAGATVTYLSQVWTVSTPQDEVKK